MLTKDEQEFIDVGNKCGECEQLNMYCGTYMWCEEYDKLCVDVFKLCTGKEGKVYDKE